MRLLNTQYKTKSVIRKANLMQTGVENYETKSKRSLNIVNICQLRAQFKDKEANDLF